MSWITTDNVLDETWRRLLAFANADFAVDQIIHYHGAPSPRQSSNYRKQARHIRAALIQANEYFQAASHSSAVTAPNHLYYGIVCLGSAAMLLRGDGSKSLDYLRTNPKNRNHGLVFVTSSNEAAGAERTRLLVESFVEVSGAGHFGNVYETLLDREDTYCVEAITTPSERVRRRAVFGATTRPPLKSIARTRRSLFEIAASLPEVSRSSRELAGSCTSSRVNIEIERTLDAAGSAQSLTMEWRVHGAPSASGLEAILKMFEINPRLVPNVEIEMGRSGTGCIVRIRRDSNDLMAGNIPFRFPSVREDLHADQYIYGIDITAPEFVDYYQIAFGLSMLSRYFPDLWISCLDSHCASRKVIESFLHAAMRKAPLLALRQMMGEDVVISLQRPSWFIT